MLDCTSSASRPNATSTRLGYIVTSRRCHARLASFSWRIFASEDLVLLHQFQLWLELEAGSQTQLLQLAPAMRERCRAALMHVELAPTDFEAAVSSR